ncbi:MAG TPA: membrane dipeptidase [Pirellulales bacterium]|jgi:membrane dipeptidase|nr:membrane dipeptidase [Pirellulales bacterium]
MLLFDCHLDLSMNALEWNRDITRPVEEIRRREQDQTDKRDRGRGTVALPDMRRGQIGLCVATQIARYVAPGNKLPGWHSPEIAWAQTQGQLAWYRAMEEVGELVQIVDVAGLERQLAIWQADPPADAPIGYILSLEGADSIRTPRHLEQAYAQGLRALGPAHYGPGRYAQGTHATGGLTAAGVELLKEMDRLGMILDATHLCDDSFWQAMDLYHGPVWASHSNCRELVPNDRQFSDEQLKVLIDRGAVIGGVLDAWMMIAGWQLFKTLPEEMGLKLERLLDHMDHICQLAGNARHIGIGSDLDGGFGREQCPMDLDTIADLSRLPDMLAARGYAAADIELIAHGNWIRFLRDAWKK